MSSGLARQCVVALKSEQPSHGRSLASNTGITLQPIDLARVRFDGRRRSVSSSAPPGPET